MSVTLFFPFTGTYVKQKCSSDQEKGICAPCEKGTYAEHPTGMDQCLQCSQCHRGKNLHFPLQTSHLPPSLSQYRN